MLPVVGRDIGSVVRRELVATQGGGPVSSPLLRAHVVNIYIRIHIILFTSVIVSTGHFSSIITESSV